MAAGLVLALAGTFRAAPAAAQTCPPGPLSTAKSSALYLYFPTAADATFPSYGGQPTSPLNAFNMSNHDAAISTSQVRQRVLQLMEAAYCEFDVKVKLATTTPSPSESRWQIVGLGSDSSTGPVGKAQAVDTNDSDSQDYCRVWVETLESWTGSALSGGNSTLERWSTAIANLTAHESAHNYGAMHSESAPRPGEDATPNHFIADPAMGATPSSISDSLNHFSDRTYERFGHNIGLNVKTLHNWDFVNPNSTNGNQLTIRLLSSASSLTIGWSYSGTLSPWTSPTVTKQAGTITFRGVAYNIFDLDFSVAKAWSGGANGIAPPGVKFHVGASFNQGDPVIVYEVTLKNGGTALALKPRMFGYDAGTNGSGFALKFYNPHADRGPLTLSDLRVVFLPRMVDLEQMVEGGELISPSGLPVQPFERQPGTERVEGVPILDRLRQGVTVGDEPFVFPIARLTDRRHLDEVIREGECEPRGGGPNFGDPRVVYCPTPGNALSLFPATYTFAVATVTDPNAHYWDPSQGQFVDGPLESRVFFQVGGIIPDANDNGIDDLIDIRSGTSKDENDNGIPDEAEGTSGRFAVNAHIGVASPEGSAANVLDSGFSLDLGLEMALHSRFSLLGILGYDQLSGDEFGDLDITHLSINGRYYLRSGVPVLPFIQGGLGAYDLNPGDTEVGANLGVGLRWDFALRLSLEALYQRHEVETPGSTNLEYSTAQIGLRWQL